MLPDLSLYVHIPWCIQKCPYCDFNSHAVKDSLPEDHYIDVLLQDLSADIEFFKIDRKLNSIFIGGGTPSLFSPEALAKLLTGIKQQLAYNAAIEITLEANPGTFESHKFAEFKDLGINRLSIGVQSFDDVALKKLGRVHSSKEACKAIEIAQKVGFKNFNLDLMFGLPAQTKAKHLADIRQALAFQAPHLSLYQLTLEPNTYFYKYPPKLPQDELIFTMQQTQQELLAANGYENYEISAYAQDNAQAMHNLNYWKFGDYLGIGAGAHGKISLELPNKIYRTCKPKHPTTYLTNFAAEINPIVTQSLPLEFLMNQLRLNSGFYSTEYKNLTGLSLQTLEPELSNAIQMGLIMHRNGKYACSEQGWLFLDNLLEKFIY